MMVIPPWYSGGYSEGIRCFYFEVFKASDFQLFEQPILNFGPKVSVLTLDSSDLSH